jgi:hypothetical protein
MKGGRNTALIHTHKACRNDSLGTREWDDHEYNGRITISLDINESNITGIAMSYEMQSQLQTMLLVE